ncbi:MAG TPA: GMC family oxidoreductase N-terminal domain-containing protein [Candidatus Acidoferrales bacterium]|nr:GMC family oxidoreductase N-terminal domain-containing protein [Candidatus Acidoferrales bacterium]
MGTPDRRELGEGIATPVSRYDTVIVGAGSAGAVLAARLSEDPSRTVCLVEAGPDHEPDALPEALRDSSMIDERHRDYLWHHVARATELRPELAIPSGRVVGGSSAINTTVYLWALRDDLDGWAKVAGDSWRYDACVPYFQRMETDHDFPAPPHGTSGPIQVHRPPRESWSPAALAYLEACTARGFRSCPDHNAPDAEGCGPVPFNTHEGRRMSAAVAYLAPARERANLRILADTTACRVVFERGRATGVEIERGGARSVIPAREVILSAGAIGSAHLLLLSGVGPAGELARHGLACVADRRGVGRNLRNHPLVGTSWHVTDRYAATAKELPIPWQVQLRTTAPASRDHLDVCLGAAVLTKYTPNHVPRIGVSVLLMHAASAGALRLANTDPHTQPVIDLGFLEAPEDLARMRASIALAIELGNTKAFNGLRIGLAAPEAADLSSPRALDDWTKRNVLTSHHPCGTARMGAADDPDAVTDAQGRVYGVEGLRVVDASIMPDCPRVNINATTMMVAEKIAEAMCRPS